MKGRYRGYEPNAIVINKGRYERHKRLSTDCTGVERRYTYIPCDTLEKAKECIRGWGENFILLMSWIEHSDDRRKVCVKIYEENVRSLDFLEDIDTVFDRREIA